MFAVFSYKGNQYKVEPEKSYKIDLLERAEDQKDITFNEVMLLSDEKETKVGNPFIEGASVEAEIIEDVREAKITVFKFHAKKRYKRTKGHRQSMTLIKVTQIKK